MNVMWLPLVFLGCAALLGGLWALFSWADWEGAYIGAAAAGLFMLLVFLLLTPAGFGDRAACHRIGSSYGVSVEWQWIGGCFVEAPNGRLIPQNQWIVPELPQG